jgi:hypothetical protein
MLMSLVGCWFFIILLALSLIKPLQSTTLPSKDQESFQEPLLEQEQEEFMDAKAIFADSKFRHLFVMNFCSVFYGYVLIGSYKVFGSKLIKDDMFLTMVGSVGCVFGSLRFFWSLLLDYNYKYTQVYALLCSVQVFCSLFVF